MSSLSPSSSRSQLSALATSATTLVCQGHIVLAPSRSNDSATAKNLGRLKHSTLFVDVLSVKEFPKNFLLELFPSDFNVLYTHSMFKPESTLDGWTGLSFVFEELCFLDEEYCVSCCEKFFNAFAKEDYRMVEMSCEDHDHYVVNSYLQARSITSHITLSAVSSMVTLSSHPHYYYHPSIIRIAFFLPTNHFACASSMPLRSLTMSQSLPKSSLSPSTSRSHQFFATILVCQGHTILAHSCSNHSAIARKLGVSFFQNTDNLCEEHPKVILLYSSIISMDRNSLRRSSLSSSSPIFDILCTHPKFGPKSTPDGSMILSFVFEKVCILDEEHCVFHYKKILNAFSREGCRMVEMSCEDHDCYAASS
ncbi:hypothetical protein Ahy_A06g029124 [Arachis hypogaea]|uniref:Prephenate/arogenate dehydrogenase domain-containing protein n=1 Tax=Arachis hypogaea TaxID=3818 RepID=A0A445CSH0_ARAHY|nr:hypothetical protein Ahy_A06g029124 [Arachis hypogaea]